jgi:transcriptional regulator with PAS, ATPase and Fis domain
MKEIKGNPTEGERAFETNPFSPDNRRPEDIVRLFYTHNVPIIPVVSKRGLLFGILNKNDVVSELSDIGRIDKIKTDDFVTKLARKMTLDELLPYGGIKEFIVVNIFGELQGKWSRLELFKASENQEGTRDKAIPLETEQQKEDQILEWMIYLILEHLPRPLYAVNSSGKTIFYNGHFEELYRKQFKKDVNIDFVEKAFSDAEKNELLSDKNSDELVFYNRDIKLHYEKIPLMNKRKKVGFLLYCSRGTDEKAGSLIPGVDIRSKSLTDIIDAIERLVIVDLLENKKNIDAAAKSLKISRKSFIHKMKKHGIQF